MYTIKDLSEGRVAVRNDGTLEELVEVLALAFPHDKYTIWGSNEFYFRKLESPTEWWSGQQRHLCGQPVQSAKDFLIKEVAWEPTSEEEAIDGLGCRSIYLGVATDGRHLFRHFGNTSYYYSNCVSKVPRKISLTLEEIANKFECDVDQISIDFKK